MALLGMVVVCDLRGDLFYASAVQTVQQALQEASQVYSLREGARVMVGQLMPRPWSAVPFTLHSLNLMASARA